MSDGRWFALRKKAQTPRVYPRMNRIITKHIYVFGKNGQAEFVI
jgi:hypothetical protein